ncbi:hypothetical protein DL769_005228 [Monosporascus sp. CRB-8-3]|nr:hypothetical protein DL769_005228 [Monosporascus sp. CRB-8-3]
MADELREATEILRFDGGLNDRLTSRVSEDDQRYPFQSSTSGFAAFILIVVVLARFDQQSLPDWPSKITLNTFVAFFTTLGKAAFMFPVSMAISQTQWTWFHRERPLYDFHVFDQASRGAWGSLVLLWRIRFRHFVAPGAALMVLTFLTSPLTQLAISYPVRDVLAATEGAKVLAIRTINAPTDRLDTGTRKAMLLATVADASDFLTPIEPLGAFCSTGNCTFDTYQSLGVCVKTANITSQLRIQDFDGVQVGEMPLLGDDEGSSIIPAEKIWNASLPGGYDMLHQTPLAVMTDTLNGGDSFGFTNVTTLLQTRIASFVLIYTTPLVPDTASRNQSDEADVPNTLAVIPNFRHEAMEILFHICVQSYDTNVHMGVEESRLIGEISEPVGLKDDFFLDLQCRNLVHDKVLVCETNPDRWDDVIHLKDSVEANSTVGEIGFSANYRSMEMMATMMKVGMGGYARAHYHPQYHPNAGVYTGGGDLVQTLFQDVVYNLHGISNITRRDIGLTNYYLNIATTLSSVIRVGRPQRYTHGAFNITGQAWKEATYVHITWGWIAFLASELVLAAGFLIITIIVQSKSGNGRLLHREDPRVPRDIKNSSLATLAALSKECREMFSNGIHPMDELKSAAKGLRVRLDGSEIVPVVAEDELPPSRTDQMDRLEN